MVNFAHCEVAQVSVHQVGNKTNDENMILSKTTLDVSDEKLRELLFEFFLKPFFEPELFNFTFSNNDISLNPLFRFSSNVFENNEFFHENTQHIAKYLYETSNHPNIKSGDLFVSHLDNVEVAGQMVDAIGIFKSENKHAFLKLNQDSDGFSLNYDDGINIDKLDKGCIIFNINKEQGYKVCIVDKSNKSTEAHFWKDDFLCIKPCSDEFHQTKDFLTIAKDFVTQKMPEEFQVRKADKIDLLNRSVEYFKSNESFDKQEFEEQVFQDEEVIKSFRDFDSNYRETNDIDIIDSFEISPQAVKKQVRIFKSVLKLDKNFHIYIHGNRKLIEQGVESDGRKFYKIYYDEEK